MVLTQEKLFLLILVYKAFVFVLAVVSDFLHLQGSSVTVIAKCIKICHDVFNCAGRPIKTAIASLKPSVLTFIPSKIVLSS